MKYAHDVIALMSAYPGRPYRPRAIVHYVCPRPIDKKELHAVRIGVRRVLLELMVIGSVIEKTEDGGKRPFYCWRK